MPPFKGQGEHQSPLGFRQASQQGRKSADVS